MPGDTLLVIRSSREMPSFQVLVGSPKIRSMVVKLNYLNLHVTFMKDGYMIYHYIWLVDCLEILSPHPPELGGQSDNSLLTNHKPIGAPETCHPIDSCYWNGVFIQWQLHSTTKRRCLKSSSTENDKPTRHHFLSNLLVTCIFFFHFPIPSYFLTTSQPWSIAEPLEYVWSHPPRQFHPPSKARVWRDWNERVSFPSFQGYEVDLEIYRFKCENQPVPLVIPGMWGNKVDLNKAACLILQ